jgi:6-phospho-3-hexuloisomerase
VTSDDSFSDALRLVSDELITVARAIADEAGADGVLTEIDSAKRIFLLGAGRSGLALRMTTTPAIAEGDLLITASGSGTTAGIVRSAATAREVGARIVALSTTASSPLADLSDRVLVIPAAAKLDRSGTASAQYAGSLFEQAVVLVGDALFHALWQRSGARADELWPRHANLE